MAKFVVDTNIFIHAIRDDTARRELSAWQRRMAPYIYQHAVVVSEILVGARSRDVLDRWHERWVAPAERLSRVIAPSYSTWTRATRIIVRLVESGRLGVGRLKPGFFNDCLLAASARDHGYTIVTNNLGDFALIARIEPKVEVVPPFP